MRKNVEKDVNFCRGRTLRVRFCTKSSTKGLNCLLSLFIHRQELFGSILGGGMLHT